MSASFNSEEVKLFEKILQRACAEMNVQDEATRSLIAMRIMHLAEQGVRDPVLLLSRATLPNPFDRHLALSCPPAP